MPTAIVVGGGLAGMVIARELASRKWRVTILERSQRLGGKAGSDLKNGRRVEHGYHVFPQWYPNVRAILARIGVQLIDFDRYYFVRLREYPRLITVRGLSGPRAVFHNIFRGLLPWYHNILYFYSVIDMLSRPLSETRLLDHVSHIGLMRAAWYVSESVAELHQENVLKATAIPAYDISAMTVKRFLGYWVRQANPFLSVLPGDLQAVFIEPQVRELEALGVDIRYGAEVTGLRVHDGAVASVRLRDGAEVTGDVFALCTPFEVTRKWVQDELYALDPELGNLHLLEAQPMAALHLRLRHRMPHLPREHVFLHRSHYGLSFIDVSQVWEVSGPSPRAQRRTGGQSGPEAKTALSFIASNYAPLASLSDEGAKDAMIEEIGEYLPIKPSDVESWEINPNTQVPLFINTIGAWPNRPRPTSQVRNLYLAGDFVKNGIDLACMEGAVSAALEAAREILRDAGETEGLPVPRLPPVWPRGLLVAARIGFVPVVALVRAIAWVEETLFPRRPDASAVRQRATPGLRRDPRPTRKRHTTTEVNRR
jgi:uncharacterized protein with NAD-binding domain and iron-sulfur cluster